MGNIYIIHKQMIDDPMGNSMTETDFL